MHAATDRLEFAPPATPGLLRSIVLAVLAHTLLVAALSWGLRWKHDDRIVAVEAELWASVPVQAAPPLVEEAPPPPPPEPVKAVPRVSNADIALEREKERKAKAKLEQEKREQDKREQVKREQEKRALEKKAAEEVKKKEQLKAKEEAQLADKRQREAIQRMTGLAGASGGSSSSGTALKSAGPSASYAGRIVARVKPNIVFTEDSNLNLVADVEVRTSPDGTIVGRKLLKSSGNKAWDEAVLKALDKTEVLPRDVDGQVPSPLVIGFKSKD